MCLARINLQRTVFGIGGTTREESHCQGNISRMGAQAVRLSNADIDNALNNRDFEVLFQPIFDLGNGALARMETFVRWRHPSLGVLPPGAFISFFESQGRMSELSRYVLDEALSNYLNWRGNYGPGFSINLALTDLNDGAIASHLTVLMREHDFPADAVTLECPMPPVTMDPEQAREQFEALRKTGARLAIEVRGRANDFLRNVEPFPFDEIKTGGAAILRFARTVRGPGLSAISELLDIANNSKASITAVGVEDQASLSALRGLGFSAAQGNHLAKVGGLNDFRPAMVNSVRKLLDLDDLTSSELGDLFRTGRPEQGVKEHSSQEDIQVDEENRRAVLSDASPVQSGSLDSDSDDVEVSTISNVTDAEINTVSEDNSDAADLSDPAGSALTAERARRKAALLVKKRGKDALRVEIAARRKKLGLSAPKISGDTQVSAARGLQDRLSSEFKEPDDNFQELSEKGVETVIESDLPEGTVDLPLALTGESDSQSESEHERQSVQDPVSTVLMEEPVEAAIIDDPTSAMIDRQPAIVDEVLDATPEPITGANSSTNGPEVHAADDVVQASLAIKGSGAYLIDVWMAKFEPKEVEEIGSVNSELKIERQKMESNLVLFSLDDPVSPHEQEIQSSLGSLSGNSLGEAEVMVEPGEESNLVFIDDIASGVDDNSVNTTLPGPQDVTQLEPFVGSQGQTVEDQQPLPTSSDVEESMIQESLVIADVVPKLPRRKKTNILTRKYRLWPDHFWPKSWRRTWHKREANRDFVRRARLRAENLGGSDDEPRDSLF